jgi:hypothetical protein
MKRASSVPVVMMWLRGLGGRFGMRVVITKNGMPGGVAGAAHRRFFSLPLLGSGLTHSSHTI